MLTANRCPSGRAVKDSGKLCRSRDILLDTMKSIHSSSVNLGLYTAAFFFLTDFII